MPARPILVINSGSSSLKFGIYIEKNRGEEEPLIRGIADGIGRSVGQLELKDDQGRVLQSKDKRFRTQVEAFDQVRQSLAEQGHIKPAAIAHRVVHGGPRLTKHQLITTDVIRELRECVHFAPLHIPASLEIIEKAASCYACVPEFACFDTAFHTTMPEVAARFPLPSDLWDEGIRRYGFHGLSYESAVYQLGRELASRTVIAHLGNGSSVVAIRDGRSVDTSMGLTPTGGIPMATRTGDLDPGVLLYLQRARKMDTDSLERLLNRESGLTAFSGGMSDMRDLEAAADKGNQPAKLGIAAFCMAIRKTVGAYAAVLGGLDMLVFTGGIGEHSARIRSNVCEGLSFLGVSLDKARNAAHERSISSPDSGVTVRVVAADEDRQIARHCRMMWGPSIADSILFG